MYLTGNTKCNNKQKVCWHEIGLLSTTFEGNGRKMDFFFEIEQKKNSDET